MRRRFRRGRRTGQQSHCATHPACQTAPRRLRQSSVHAAAERIATAPAPSPAAAADDRELRSLRDEVRTLRDLLESQLSRLTWNDNVRRNAAATTTMRNLVHLGITPDVVRHRHRRARRRRSLRRSPGARRLKQLVDSIPVCDDDLIAAGGVFAVVGPTGVGKTTTIAKLAARYALTGRPEDIALVTTDTFRIGAREQLETFGEILGTPVYQAADSARLAEILTLLAGRRLVLIDTAGHGPARRAPCPPVVLAGSRRQQSQGPARASGQHADRGTAGNCGSVHGSPPVSVHPDQDGRGDFSGWCAFGPDSQRAAAGLRRKRPAGARGPAFRASPGRPGWSSPRSSS